MTLKFNVSKEDATVIERIAERATKEYSGLVKRTLIMDLTVTHANGCPLRLADFLAAPAFDFAHDVFGITEHLDRKTGTLGDFFWPRFSRPVSETCEHDWQEQPGEPPVDVCPKCGAVRR